MQDFSWRNPASWRRRAPTNVAGSGAIPLTGSRRQRGQDVVCGALVAALSLLFAGVMGWLSVARHKAYQSHAFDLGNMDQAVWNTAHGRFLRFTDMSVHGRVLTDRLAIHVEPLLALFAPAYLVYPNVSVLLVAQAVVVASGAVPAYLLARSLLGSPGWALVFPLAYLCHPSLQNAVLDDFHAVTLSAAFLMWAAYAVHRRWVALFIPMSVLAAATKEEVGLVVALLGLWLAWNGRRMVGGATALLGAVWFTLCVAVIIPAANPAGSSPYLGRYSYLGHGLMGVLLSPLRHPGVLVSALGSAHRLAYFSYLLHPTGFVALLGLPLLLVAAPAALVNLLSADSRMYSGFYQYSAEIVPITVAAAALGVARVGAAAQRWRAPAAPWVPRVLCVLVALAALMDCYRDGFTPLSQGYGVPAAGAHQRLEDQLVATVPESAVVAAADEMEPHLSHRKWIYLLPDTRPVNGPPAQYIALDASVPSAPVGPQTLFRAARHALSHGYGVQFARDGVLLLRRGAPIHRLPAGFFSFATTRPVGALPVHARWGPLQLRAVIVHPRGLLVNRSRPGVGVETYWTVQGRMSALPRISISLGQVYGGTRPPFRGAERTTQSPALAWLPLRLWRHAPVVHAAFVPIAPDTLVSGKVDVVLTVQGLGPVRGVSGASGLAGSRSIRIATVRVGP